MSRFTEAQELAINTTEENVTISAGAGSGKTEVLVTRFLRILEKGMASGRPVRPEQILAFTFTRKAATEMKERVRGALTKKMEAPDLNDKEKQLWQEYVNKLEICQICTIDSFCTTVLREHPVEAGIDPSFAVSEEYELKLLQQELVQEYIKQGLDKKVPAVRILSDYYGLESFIGMLDGLRSQSEQVLSHSYEELRQTYEDSLLSLPELELQLAEALEAIAHLGPEAVKATAQLENLAELLENLEEVKVELGQNSLALTNKYLGKINLTGCRHEEYKELVKNAKELRTAIISLLANKEAIAQDKTCGEGEAWCLLQCWYQVLSDIAAVVAEGLEIRELFSFDSVERKTLELLRIPAIRKHYHEKFRYLMVDEFQDTNELQKRLVYLLCGDSEEQLSPSGNGVKLFVVGDPKQSIYGFRGAEVNVFQNIQKDIVAQGGVKISMDDNFRSSNAILETVNTVFEPMMNEGAVEFEALKGHIDLDSIAELANAPADKPEFMAVETFVERTDCTTDQLARASENELLARKIAFLHGMGYNYYQDAEGKPLIKRDEEGKPALGIPYNKIFILLRGLNNVQGITDALKKHDVPYQVLNGKGFYDQQEVLDVLHLFQFLVNKRRSLELMGILRSPYFGINDETLTKLYLAMQPGQCLWEQLQLFACESLEKEQAGLLNRAKLLLSELQTAALELPLPLLWTKVRRVLQLEAVNSRQEDGQQKLANTRKLEQLALEFAAKQNGSMVSWLQHIEEWRAAEQRETAANLESTNAVTIMTIHGSKGLTMDTVFLPQLDAKDVSDTREIAYGVVMNNDNKLPALGIKTKVESVLRNSGILDDVKMAGKAAVAYEKIRLLYVAMTRARYRLYFSGAYKENSQADSWFNQLYGLLQEKSEIETPFRCLHIAGEEDLPELPGQRAVAQVSGLREDMLAPLPGYEAAKQLNFTPSMLESYIYCPRSYFYDKIAMLPAYKEPVVIDEATRELPAWLTGSIVHKALELYGTEGYTEPEKAFQQALQSETKGLSYGTAKAKMIFANYLESAEFKAIPKQHQRELEIEYSFDDLHFYGVIDCLYEEEDGFVILDYKTRSAPEDGSIPEGYACQLSIYKAWVEKHYPGKLVKKVALHFLQQDKIQEVELTDTEAFEKAVALANSISGLREEAEFPCKGTPNGCRYCSFSYICEKGALLVNN